jgi:PKHD-type hydroxylase
MYSFHRLAQGAYVQYMITPYAEVIEPFVWWEGAFSEQELDWLQQQAINADTRAQVGGNPQKDELSRIRRSKISWMPNSAETKWVFEKLAHVASSLNSQFYRFDLTGFGEALQLTNYDQSEHGMYGWHQDYGGNRAISRKLSMVLQLTDPSQYEGGNLQIMTGTEPITVRKQRGLIAAFPSYIVHQVTPVTQGNRQSLVAWVSGPSFK